MDIRINWNGNNITSHIISYNREQAICDGVGTFTFKVAKSSSLDFSPWDEIALYEEGTKKGTYFIIAISKAVPSGEMIVDCQDGSKRMSDTFIDQSYFIDYPTRTRTWIEKFLNEAGVTYSFNVGDSGTLLSNNTTLGYDFVLGVVTSLLKQSGWYITFDPENVATVGKVNLNFSGAANLGPTEILEMSMENSDKSLRNRTVVWGGAGYYPGSQIGVSAETTTPWDIDKKDKRSIVFTHSGVRSSATAYDIAYKLLNEFDTISSVKTVKLAGAYNLKLSDVVNIYGNDVYNGNGVITTIRSEMSSSGLTTTLVLDEKCPRMFAFYNYGDQYVYIGTAGEGVHRKPLPSPVWEDYSTGLINKYIRDLKVNNGLLVCVTNDGHGYKRLTSESTWTRFNHGTILDRLHLQYDESITEVIACAINRSTNDIYFGVSLKGTTDKCWILKTNSALEIKETIQVVVFGNDEVGLLDIDTDDKSTYATITLGYDFFSHPDVDYCSEFFTTNLSTTETRGLTGGTFYSVTTPIFCNGRIFFVGQTFGLPTRCRAYRVDHRNDPEVVTTSSSYTLSADRYIISDCKYDSSENLVTFYAVDTSTGDYYDVITYSFDTDTFTFVETIYVPSWPDYQNVGYVPVPWDLPVEGDLVAEYEDAIDGTIYLVDVDQISISSSSVLLHYIDPSKTTVTNTMVLGGLNLLNHESLYQVGGGENVFYFSATGGLSGNALTKLVLVEFSDWTSITVPGYYTARENQTEGSINTFITIDKTSRPHQLEISKNSLISTFAYSGMAADCIRVGYSGGNFTSIFPNILEVTFSGAVNDIRVIGTSVEQVSGYLSLAAAQNLYLDITPLPTVNWSNLQTTLSGTMARIEATNRQFPASLFYDRFFGTAPSGSNAFYQRLTGQTTFQNMSMSIPHAKVLQIRMDDRV